MRRFLVAGVALAALVGAATSAAFLQAAAAPLWTLSGVVEDTTNSPVAGAAVHIAPLRVGASSTSTATTYLASVLSAADGSFTIPAPSFSEDVLTQIANNDGWLNLWLSATPSTAGAGTYVGTADGDAMYYGGMGVAVLSGPSKASNAPIGTVKMKPNGVKLIVYQVKADPTGTGTHVGVPTPCNPANCYPATSQTNPTPQPGPYCTDNWYRINSNTYWEPVGELHTWQDEQGDFEYSQTASTTFDVGFNFNDQGWGLSGNSYIGNTESWTVPLGVQAPYTANHIDGEFGMEMDENDDCGTMYRIVPTEWTGGIGVADSIGGDGPSNYYSVPAQYHADFPRGGQKPIKTSGTGYHYSWQVSAFGVTLGDETDWSTQVTTTWYIGKDCSAGLHSLFSYGAPPADANSQLVFASTETDQAC